MAYPVLTLLLCTGTLRRMACAEGGEVTATPQTVLTTSKLDVRHPRWSQLTPNVRSIVGNGCGSKGGWFKPPNFMFEASCDQHDFYYWRGGTEGDRQEADAAFLRAMLRDAGRTDWWVRWLNRRLAYTYARAVWRHGKAYFHYRSGPATWDDLNALVGQLRERRG
jgi:hypothetical protein